MATLSRAEQVLHETLSPGSTVTLYAANELLFSQGDLANSVFQIQRGKVKLTVVSGRGKEAIIALLREGDFCGEGCLLGPPLRTATASALSECSVLRFEKAGMRRRMHGEPAFAEMFLQYLLTRNHRIEEDLVDQLFNSSEKRLARALLLMAKFGQEGDPLEVIPKVSQEMLAGIVGTTRSRISFFMNRFRRQNFIEYKDGLVVHPSLLNFLLQDA